MADPSRIYGADMFAALGTLTARSIMHAPIVTCRPDAPIASVAALMAEHRIHCVITDGVIEDASGEQLVWGVVSDLDLVRGSLHGDASITACEIAGTEAVLVDHRDSLEAVAAVLAEHDCAHAVVVEDGHPVGVVSTLDLATALAGLRAV